jgi:hypothetical protein
MVTMSTNLFTVGNNGNHGNQVGLDCLCTMATKLLTLGNHGNYGNQVTLEQKGPKGVVGFRCKRSMDIV